MADGRPHHHHEHHKHHDKQAAIHVRSFLQQHLQPTLQFTVAVALCSILVFVRSVTFPLACLAGVFVVVLHVLLVRDHHVGTLLLSSCGLLGAVWLGVLSAGILVTLTLQSRTKAVHLAVLTVVASIVFGVYGIVKVTPLPFRLMLQGTNLMMTFGMSVVLSLFAPTVPFLWSYFISHMLLAFAAAALASCVAGIVVLPSFATEAAISNVVTALRKTGQTGTMCVSLLLRPGDDSKGFPGSYSHQNLQQLGALPDNSSQQPPAAEGDSNGAVRRPTFERHASLQVEDLSSLVAHPSQELDMFMHYTTPGQWGIKSFMSAQSVASTRSATSATAGATAAAAATGGAGGGRRPASMTAPAGDIDTRAAVEQESVAGHAAAAATTAAAVDDPDASATDATAAAADVDRDVVINLHKYSTSSSSSTAESDHDSAHEGSVYNAAAAANSKKKKRHLGFNLLKKLSHTHHHHHHKQQQQPQQSVIAQQQHLFVRLGRGVDLIRPHLLETRLLHDSVAVEQAWWVRLLVGGVPLPEAIHIQDWQALVNALDMLLDRVAALEGMLEGGPDRTSLSSLASYATLRSTCGQIFAQAAALCGSLSTALQARLQQRQQQHSLINRILHCCRPGSSSNLRSRSGLTGSACPMLGICWEASRQQLLEVMHSETQQYFARLAAADQSRPFRLDPARAMIGMMFLSTLSLGTIEAAQKLQTTGQIVLYGRQCTPAAADDGNAPAPAAAEAAAAGNGRGAGSATGTAADVEMQPTPKAAAVMQAAAATPGVAADAHSARADPAAAVAATNSGKTAPAAAAAAAKKPSSSGPNNSSTAVLLDSLLCLSVFRRLHNALLQQLPTAVTSKQAFSAMIHKRRFQAGFKLWLVSSIALAVVVIISVVWPTLPPNVMMFGFMAIVFTMKERVESSTEMVIIRVGSTVVGACLGHLLMFNPKSAEQPWGLVWTLLFFAFILPPFTGGQFRLMLCLGLITLNSMILCQYVGCCGAAGSLIYFLGRIIATGGGTLFAMMVNRLILPWERDRWALEEMSQVLGLAVSAAEGMYQREFAFVAELTGHDPVAKNTSTTAGDANGDHVAIAVPQLEQQQHQQQRVGGSIQLDTVRPPAAAAAAAAGSNHHPPAGAAVTKQQDATAVNKQQHHSHHHHHPQQQQQQQQSGVDPQRQLAIMQGLLAPVSLAVQRDTWMKWKWAELAIPPVVPVMLSAVQQLSDALAALKVTLAQICDISKQQQQSATAAAAVRMISSSGSSMISVAGHGHEASEWRSVLLFDEFASLVHGNILEVFRELQDLVGLVQQQVRSPTQERKDILIQKIAQIHQLRVAISIKYVKLRNARFKNLRQRFTAMQQQHGEQQQQQQSDGLWASELPADSGVHASSPSSVVAVHSSTKASQQQQQQQQQQGELLPSDPRSLQVDLASVQYLAFVYALRRVFNRALAVARCVADE